MISKYKEELITILLRNVLEQGQVLTLKGKKDTVLTITRKFYPYHVGSRYLLGNVVFTQNPTKTTKPVALNEDESWRPIVEFIFKHALKGQIETAIAEYDGLTFTKHKHILRYEQKRTD